jgi:Family of unknown function (DUF6098)
MSGTGLDASSIVTITDFDRLVRVVDDQSGPVYLRYSRGPHADAGGRPSRDYESGALLPGLSVTTLTPEPWWDRPTADWIARRVCKYAELGEQDDDRRAWLLVGEVVGRGPDHEPLIGEFEPLAWLDRAVVGQAHHHYRARFDVGRSSR